MPLALCSSPLSPLPKLRIPTLFPPLLNQRPLLTRLRLPNLPLSPLLKLRLPSQSLLLPNPLLLFTRLQARVSTFPSPVVKQFARPQNV